MPKKKTSNNDYAEANGFGIVIAGLCLIHGVSIPIANAILPNAPQIEGGSNAFHQLLAMVSLMIALLTFLPGYWQHRRRSVVALASCGLLLQLLAAFAFSDLCCSGASSQSLGAADPYSQLAGQAMTPVACVLLLAAHGFNWHWASSRPLRTAKRCRQSSKPR